eukprot:jgi/Mesvir1/15388/Mv06577-RA.3
MPACTDGTCGYPITCTNYIWNIRNPPSPPDAPFPAAALRTLLPYLRGHPESPYVLLLLQRSGEGSPADQLQSIFSARYPGVPLHFTSTERELFGDVPFSCGFSQVRSGDGGPGKQDAAPGSGSSQLQCQSDKVSINEPSERIAPSFGIHGAGCEHGGQTDGLARPSDVGLAGEASPASMDRAGSGNGLNLENAQGHPPGGAESRNVCPSPTPTDRLRMLVASIGGGGGDDASAREDLMAHLRGIALRRVAARHGYNKLAIGTNATRMAVAAVTVTVQGRGDMLPGELSWVDDRVADDDVVFEGGDVVTGVSDGVSVHMASPVELNHHSTPDGFKVIGSAIDHASAGGSISGKACDGNAGIENNNSYKNNNTRLAPVTVIRPLRDCLAKELAVYCHLHRIPTVTVPSLSSPLARWWAPVGAAPSAAMAFPVPSSARLSVAGPLPAIASLSISSPSPGSAAGSTMVTGAAAAGAADMTAPTSPPPPAAAMASLPAGVQAATGAAAAAGATTTTTVPLTALRWKPMGGGARVSINRLCEEFVAGLQHNLASTLTTLHQTALKISTPGQRMAERARKETGKAPPCCALCSAFMPLPVTPRGIGSLAAAFCAPCRTQVLGLRHPDELPSSMAASEIPSSIAATEPPVHSSVTACDSPVSTSAESSAAAPAFSESPASLAAQNRNELPCGGGRGTESEGGDMTPPEWGNKGASTKSGSEGSAKGPPRGGGGEGSRGAAPGLRGLPPVMSSLPELVVERARRFCGQRGGGQGEARVGDACGRPGGEAGESSDRSAALRHHIQEYLL